MRLGVSGHNLTWGFPLVGKLPRSGTSPQVGYEDTCSMEGFMEERDARNAAKLERVRALAVADREVHSAFDGKAAEEDEPFATTLAQSVCTD